MTTVDDQTYRERVYELVRSIPKGRVMTYGQIALILGEGYTARTVGYVMHGADSAHVPWQRVINAQGKCSTARLTMPLNLQQELLTAEGVEFSAAGRCDLGTYLWFPDNYSEPDEQAPLFVR
jgi:methylated-DNA-protein-cysteine methyltransferase-like protein